MRFNPLGIVKYVVAGAVGIGTTKIVNDIIKAHVSPEKLSDRISTGAAAWVLGAMIADKAKAYTDEMIDKGYNAGRSIVDQFQMKAKLDRINRGESTFENEGLDVLNFRRNAESNAWELIPTEDGESTDNDDVIDKQTNQFATPTA